MISNLFIKDDCHDEQIVSFEIFEDDGQISPPENFEHVEHIGILVERIPQPTFNRETNELSQQQIKEVFCYDFEDPFADFLESMSSIDLKIFLPEEDYLYPLFKPFFCMIWLLLLFKSRSSMLPVNKFLTWLHWKHEFT
jgi:hypothetical protein